MIQKSKSWKRLQNDFNHLQKTLRSDMRDMECDKHQYEAESEKTIEHIQNQKKQLEKVGWSWS